MAHITSIGASKFASLDYVPNTANSSADSSTTILSLFITNEAGVTGTNVQTDETPQGTVVHVGDVREFPSLGTPANVVNVPVYGQATSSQVAGQSDAPSLEFSLNYVPSKHAALNDLRTANTRCCFRVRLSDADITTDVNGIQTADNVDIYDDFYFFGTVASFEVTPGLTDSMQATVTLTIEGDFKGPYSLEVSGTNSTYTTPA